RGEGVEAENGALGESAIGNGESWEWGIGSWRRINKSTGRWEWQRGGRFPIPTIPHSRLPIPTGRAVVRGVIADSRHHHRLTGPPTPAITSIPQPQTTGETPPTARSARSGGRRHCRTSARAPAAA